jgi:hypothetical protein
LTKELWLRVLPTPSQAHQGTILAHSICVGPIPDTRQKELVFRSMAIGVTGDEGARAAERLSLDLLSSPPKSPAQRGSPLSTQT